MNDCIFCKIAKGEALAEKEAETSEVVAFKSIQPVSEYHILIVPKLHIETFLDLEEGHKDVFMEMARMAQKLIDEKKISDGYKLVFNGGRYQAVKHIHWHLLGGKLEDENDALNKT